MADFNRVHPGRLYRYSPVAIDRFYRPHNATRDGADPNLTRARFVVLAETIMDDEREDEFMDSMPEPAQSHAQLLELRKRFVIYLARLDEQIRRADIKEEMDRVATADTERTDIDWLQMHVAQAKGNIRTDTSTLHAADSFNCHFEQTTWRTGVERNV